MGNPQIKELQKIVDEFLKSEKGNLDSAIQLAINFSTENSISPESLLELCHSYYSNEKDLAYIFAKTCASLSVENTKKASAYFIAGNASFVMGRLEEAEEQYKLALKEDPKNANTHNNYGNLLMQMGRLEEAEEQYKLALEEDPNDASTHNNYGFLLMQMGRLEEAEEQIKISIGLDPNMPNSHSAYGLLLFFQNLEEEAIKETEIASRLCRESGDRVKEHLSFAWLYEGFANKYYNLKDYQKSGEYADIAGDKYIEAGKQAGEKFKDTSLTKGYTLKGRAKIRMLELQPPYEIEKFKKIMNGIYEASGFYRKAAEISPKDNQTCNACSISMLCLSEMLDYMLAVIKQKNVSRLEDKIEKWKKELELSEQIYKESPRGEAFVQSLYKLMGCIENLDKYKKFAMWKEEKAFEECVEELKEIAGNIEGPLQKIIEDSAAQMDVCRRKIMPYAGTETVIFEPNSPKKESLETNTPLNPTPDESKNDNVCKKRIKLWSLSNFLIKLIVSAIFTIIAGIIVTILSDIIMKTSYFEYLLNMAQSYLTYF